MNISERIQQDRVLRGTREFSDELAPLPWSELERRLAGRPPPADQPPRVDGGDAPAWSSRRQPYRSPADRSPGEGGPGRPGRVVVPYAELHCHSNASFLDGGSHPEELA